MPLDNFVVEMCAKAKPHGLSKAEMLSGERSVAVLFERGARFVRYPLLCVWLLDEQRHSDEPPVRLLVSVAKKRLRRAVWRNTLKRHVREAYRLNKAALLAAVEALPRTDDGTRRNLRLALVFLGKEQPTYEEVLTAVRGILKKLNALVVAAQ